MISQIHMAEFLGSEKWGSAGYHNVTKYHDSVIGNKYIKVSGVLIWTAYGKFRHFRRKSSKGKF